MPFVKTAAGKIVTAGIVCAILDVILHALLAPTYAYDYAPSWFVESGLFRPAAGMLLLVIFVLFGAVFVRISKDLPGSRLAKGLRFGVSIGGLWLIGVPGMTVFFGSPLLHELLGGACDCVSIIVLGVLLGITVAADSPERGSAGPVKMTAALIIIAVVFIFGQYLAFLFMSKAPYFGLVSLSTFAWTAVLGLWAGVVYWLLREGTGKERSPVKRSLFFGCVIIGINWMLFNFFVLLFVAMPVSDPITLAGLNIVSLIAGMLIVETLFWNRNT